jgi:hypothetical protein
MNWVWVMGGTAAGKKTFIRRFSPLWNYTAFWMDDGDTDLDAMVENYQYCNLLIRWQWGREDALIELLKTVPSVTQILCLVKMDPITQSQRLKLRDDWFLPEDALSGEAQSIEELANYLSSVYCLPYIRTYV